MAATVNHRGSSGGSRAPSAQSKSVEPGPVANDKTIDPLDPAVASAYRNVVTDSKRPLTSSRPPGEVARITFRFLTPVILEVIWSGYITRASCGHYPDQLIRLLGRTTIRYAIFDALAVTGFTADSRVPGGRLLEICKRAGARRVMVVTNSSAVRMIGSTVALATGMSIRFVAQTADALEEIRRLERDA